MVLRQANAADVPRLIDLTEALVRSVGGPIAVDRSEAGASLMSMICSPDGRVWVTPGGFLAARIGRTSISRQPVAFEDGWYAEDGSGIRLMRAFLAWADERNALPKLSTPPNGVDLSRLGFTPRELSWTR